VAARDGSVVADPATGVEHVDVVVVGGGPVGMLLAAELGAHSVHAVVLERNPGTVEVPKAGTLHARTVQSLARRGYLDVEAGDRPDRMVAAPFHFAGMPGLTISAPADEGPPILGLSQAELERIFERRARRLGVRIRRGHTAVRVAPDADHVVVTVAAQHGEYVLTADYLIGADGARSVVREQAGFGSVTHPATVAALLGQVRLLNPAGTPPGWHRTPRGWTVINVNPFGSSRVITFDFSGPHADRHAPLGIDELRETASRIAGQDIPMTDATFLSRFSDFARLVTGYRRGRVFLAGDAAHVHFPVGGQGMNLGLGDAMNLGWKLAHVVRGLAPDRILDTYHAERHPAGQRVIDNTRAQLALMRPDPALDPLRELVHELLGLGQVSRHLGDMISAQEVTYPDESDASPLTGRFFPNMALTGAAGPATIAELLSDARPVLLVFTDTGLADHAAGWQDIVRTVEVTGNQAVPWRAVLLRPDGYVAWACTSESEEAGLGEALRRWFGDPSGPDGERCRLPGPAAGQSRISYTAR
jgi:2-polyprenyl-6-methoxyphenol hydroxylase-like FAD-dependent oxidoreductase